MNLRQGNKSRSNQLWLWRLSSLDVSNFFGYLLPSLQHTPCIQDNFSSNLHNFNGNWATTRLQNFLLFVVAVVAEFAATPLPYKSAEEEPKNVYWLLIVTIGDRYQGMRVFYSCMDISEVCKGIIHCVYICGYYYIAILHFWFPNKQARKISKGDNSIFFTCGSIRCLSLICHLAPRLTFRHFEKCCRWVMKHLLVQRAVFLKWFQHCPSALHRFWPPPLSSLLVVFAVHCAQ